MQRAAVTFAINFVVSFPDPILKGGVWEWDYLFGLLDKPRADLMIDWSITKRCKA